jgi:SulP family sulfate permease
MASMAALLLMVAWNMSEAKHFIRSIRIAPRDDVVVLLLCFSLTVLFDMTIAVAVGVGLAAMLFIRRSISLTETAAIEHDREGQHLPDSIMVYDINGPLFFGSAQKALKTVSSVRTEVRVVILDMTEVTMLDLSAIVAMESIWNNLRKRNIGLVINSLQPRMILKLRRAGIRKQSGRVAFSRTLEEGFLTAQTMLGQLQELEQAQN